MPEITQEELDLFNTYKNIGEPEQIAEQLNEKVSLERENTLKEVASLSGYKPNVLAKLSEGLDVKVEDGVAYVGDVAIQEYATENWSDFIPSLTEDASPKGVNFVRQPNKASDGKRSLANASTFMKNVYGQKTV